MACERGQYQYCAPDDGMWHRNSCRAHEHEIVAACDPKHSIRPFAEPPTRRWDSASRARGELAGWRESITKNTYSVLNAIVRTQKKSHAQLSEPCCLRNARQRQDGARRWVRCIYLPTVLAETLNPSPRQLRLDPPLTPKSVLGGHAADEDPKFHRDWAAAWPRCAA